MFKTTVDAAHDAASVLFNLPEYRVVAVVRDDDHGRRASSWAWATSADWAW